MIEEHRKKTSPAIERIRKGEKLYIEGIEAVSTTWEFILEDEVVEKIKEDAWKTNLNITTVKEDMKKLSIKERITKVVELKQLQQEVKTLCKQEQKRNDEMTKHQSEAERVIGIIHPIQQKLQFIT